MKITKMHGLGNNYIFVDEFSSSITETELPLLAVAVSDVRKGIGSDGLILIGPSQRADVRMRIFNADGSEAENCGNGVRCVAKYAMERGYGRPAAIAIDTLSGVVYAYADKDSNGRVHRVTVDMGEPSFGAASVGYVGEVDHRDGGDASVVADSGTWRGTMVSIGNPHFVVFANDATRLPVAEVGPGLETHPLFPRRINVEFVTVRSPQELDFRVWERGSGITYACGTGACASVAAGVKRGVLSGPVTVHLLGGDLLVEVREGHVWMTGEAVEVLTGEYEWPARG